MAVVSLLLAIYAGTELKRAAGLAAAAIAGGALTRAVDVLREQSNEVRSREERARRQEINGIDACRQLIAAISAGSYTTWAAATLTNALLNHEPHRVLLDDDDVAAIEAWKASRYVIDRTRSGGQPPREVERAFERIDRHMGARVSELNS